MNRLFTLITLLFLGGTILSAQDFESYRRQQQEAFRAYKQQTQEEWEAYRRKVNEEFAEFLGKPWEKKTGEKPVPEKPKVPDVPPVVLPEIDIDVPVDDNPIDVNVNLPQPEEEPISVAPMPYKPKPSEKSIAFTFYGTPGRVRFDIGKKASLKGADEKAVSRFWKALSGEAYDNIVADCQNLRFDRDLCDWAYLKMTEKVAEAICTSRNERVVFHAWLMSQSGFSVRIGRENGTLHLLVGTSALLFGKPFWTMKEGNYFLFDDEHVTAMNVMDASFPGTSPLRMRMNVRNEFESSVTPPRKLSSEQYPDVRLAVSCNKNLLAFLKDMPVPAREGGDEPDFMMYAQMPLSDVAAHEIYSVLLNRIIGKSEAEGANILLNFVQTAFEYKTDGEAWGYERAFFPEETLYYPYSDCEDRAILFCQLVRNLMGLEVAFVSYPGHLATAVHFTEDIPGDYFEVGGKRYLVCDPTYIHAKIGMSMPDMRSAPAQVYLP